MTDKELKTRIKFRAWDNLEKRMRKVVSLHWQGDKLVSARLEGENEPIPIEGRLVIEQGTGLKNKNGTEIYAGDICSFSSKNGKYVGIVERSDDLASFGLRMVKNNFLYTFSEFNIMGVDLDTLEVAGNIHENPELMEEK